MNEAKITEVIVLHCPDVQAVYLFGSSGTEYERPESDIDLALLLPHTTAKAAGNLALKECRSALADLLGRSVDLINLRAVNTVFQHQVVQTGRLIFNADSAATDWFEMMTLSLYQKLQEERASIVAEIVESKRILDV
jgi:predicted nucleotidyltransferase